MIKRLSMAAIMDAWIFAPGRGTTNLGAISANLREDTLFPLPFGIGLL
jgi:hypothetical protein